MSPRRYGITEKQRKERRKSLGSSDMAAVLGVSPYATAMDVYLEKTGQVEPDNSKAEFFETRGRLEPVILDWAEDQLGPIRRNCRRVCKAAPLAANIDALLRQTQEPIEAKTSVMLDQWGEPGSDQIPEDIIIQTHVHILCLNDSDIQTCYVPILLSGFQPKFVMYKVLNDHDLEDQVVEAANRFWHDHVLAGIPPEANPSLDIAKRVIREPEKSCELNPEVVGAWLAAKEVEKQAKKQRELMEAKLFANLGDAEAGIAPGVGGVTYFGYERHGIDTKLLKAEYPLVAEKCAKVSPYRSLKFKKQKEEVEV